MFEEFMPKVKIGAAQSRWRSVDNAAYEILPHRAARP